MIEKNLLFTSCAGQDFNLNGL